MNKVRLGVIGCGFRANSLYVPFFKYLENGEVIAVMDIDDGRAVVEIINAAYAGSYRWYDNNYYLNGNINQYGGSFPEQCATSLSRVTRSHSEVPLFNDTPYVSADTSEWGGIHGGYVNVFYLDGHYGRVDPWTVSWSDFLRAR